MKLISIAKIINARLEGNPDLEISSLGSGNETKAKSIIFISSKKLIPVNFSDYGAILTSEKLKKEFPNCNILISSNPRLSFAELSKIFSDYPCFIGLKSITPIKKITTGNNVSIGLNCFFGHNVVIEDNVVIGNNVIISHNSVICRDTIIGNNVNIGPGTVVGSEGFGNVRDENGSWVHIFHHGKVKIFDNVSIGSNCSIDKGTLKDTLIHEGVIIDNLVHIAHNVSIGENTAIAAKVGIAGSCVIGKRNMIGGMVGIVDHITTADDVIISATSTVNKDIKEPGTYTGIMPISYHASWKRIALWITKLDKIVKLLNLKKSKL